MSGFDTYPVFIGDHEWEAYVDHSGELDSVRLGNRWYEAAFLDEHTAASVREQVREQQAAEYQRDAIASAQSEQAFADNQRAYSARI